MDDVFSTAESIKRRRALLDAMTQQNLGSQIQGNTGLGQALAKIATGYVLGQKGQGLDSESVANRQAYATQLQDQVNNYLTTRNGIPGQTLTDAQASDVLNNDQPLPPLAEGVKADPRKAIVSAMTSQFPEMQALGKMELPMLLKQDQPLTAKEILSLPGFDAGSRVRAATGGGITALKADPHFVTVGDRVFDARNPSAGPGIDARPSFTDVRMPGAGGAVDLYQRENTTGKLTKVDNAPQIKIGVNAGQNAGFAEWAKLAAKDVQDMSEQARSSVKLLATLNQLEASGRAGVYSGPTANAATFFNGLAKTLGVPIDTARLANSETFDAAAISAWQDMIKAAGGNRGVVKEEAQRIAQMVPQLSQTPEGRKQITAYLRQSAQQAVIDAQQAQREYAAALQSSDPGKFTFGLSQTQIPRDTALPAAPGASPEPQQPVVKNW